MEMCCDQARRLRKDVDEGGERGTYLYLLCGVRIVRIGPESLHPDVRASIEEDQCRFDELG